jgi:hypothetical protein
MSPPTPFDSQSRRLAVYGYLAPLLEGRKVLELGCGAGTGSARLRSLGAASVLGLESDPTALARARSAERLAGLTFGPLERRTLEAAGRFGLIVVPEGADWLSPAAPFGLGALRALMTPDARLAVIVASSDRGETSNGHGVGYYALLDALERLFPQVRMFGLTPFAAFGAAEFGAQTAGLRIEGGLVDEGSEQPTHYLAVAGPDRGVELGYALLQIPAGAGEVGVVATEEVAAIDEESRSTVIAMRQRLVEAEGKAEGMLRVSRVQAEEIEELRARLRRGAESRGELDQEIARLRRALAEADAAVLDLTRRTREEVTELTRQLSASWRGDGRPDPAAEAAREEGSGVLRLREELRRRGEELDASVAALSQREQRIAALEAEKQDLVWRLQTAQAARIAEVRVEARSEAARIEARPPVRSPNGSARPEDQDGSEELHLREQAQQAIDQYRLAASAHLEEVNRLREALAEQSTLVNELEDALAVTSRRAQAAEDELQRLRKHTAEVEAADRARRSRLAEVEGTLLRLKAQAAAAVPPPAPASPPPPPPPPASPPPAPPAPTAAAVESSRELENAVQEAVHLREALDRTEEQLWETKGQMLLDQERLANLEQQLAEAIGGREPSVSESAHHAILGAVLDELAVIETGVRTEIGKLDSIEHFIESCRSDAARGESAENSDGGATAPRAE